MNNPRRFRASDKPTPPADKVRKGLDAYQRGPHRKAPPPRPRAKPAQMWHTPNRKPPQGWEGIDTTCKVHAIDFAYHPGLGWQVRDYSLPGPMHGTTVAEARKAISVVLAKRGAR